MTMPQIIPIRELKNTSSISELCHKSDEPVFVTKNGYGDMVLMSVELYDSLSKKWNIYNEIEISEEQIKQGKTSDAIDSLSKLKKKYDL